MVQCQALANEVRGDPCRMKKQLAEQVVHALKHAEDACLLRGGPESEESTFHRAAGICRVAGYKALYKDNQHRA